jgi:hypothetical protein
MLYFPKNIILYIAFGKEGCTMKNRFFSVALAVTVVALIFGCGAPPKPPVMLDDKQVAVFVLSDRGIKSDMNEDERKDRNEMGQFMEENLVETLKHEGYNATLIQNQNQYVPGPVNYLIAFRINNLRLVGKGSRLWVGMMSGPTILECHFDVSGSSGKLSMSYDDEHTTMFDWTISPRELNERLVKKINDRLVGKST